MMESLEERSLFSYPGFWQVTAPSSPITKFTGPSLNAQCNDVSMDTIQLSAQRLTLSPNPDPNP
jgi:hypothetical protein